VLDKQPEAAFGDEEFSHEAKHAESATFVAHVRLATAGGRTAANTHPFAMGGLIMAHNGSFGELPRIDAQLGPYRSLVIGDTDSERYFALITQQVDVHGGDVAAGITAAATWIAANLPMVALNAVVASRDELWALRYPSTHALHVLERRHPPGRGLHVRSATSSVHMPAAAPSVVVASERLDGEAGWRMLVAGELVHVGPGLRVDSAVVIAGQPARPIPLTGRNPNIDT
jgi:glutamine amidotransferase